MQMMISASTLLSILVIERVDERVGLSCLISLLSLLLVSTACERYKHVPDALLVDPESCFEN